MMLGLDGPSTLKLLRELPKFSEIPVIFFTAKVQVQDKQLLNNFGPIGIIAKHFEPMKLANQIKTIWLAAL